MKHTPGPWRIEDETRIMPPLNATQLPICKMGSLQHPQSMEANARLIAAAPELLAVCKLVDLIATGRQPAGGGSVPPTESDWLWIWKAARAAITKAKVEEVEA